MYTKPRWKPRVPNRKIEKAEIGMFQISQKQNGRLGNAATFFETCPKSLENVPPDGMFIPTRQYVMFSFNYRYSESWRFPAPLSGCVD
jgi:hypothetical protein